ncbi:hypothetical protein D3C87_1492950 [compost metagenome]
MTLQCCTVQLKQQVALLALAGELGGVIEHQHRRVGWRAQGAVEHAIERRAIAPDRGGEIQRVDQVGVTGQHLRQFADLPVIECRQAQFIAFGVVGNQPGIATGTGQCDQAVARR